MAKYNIETSPIEQEKVLGAIKQLNGATASVATIAKTAGIPQSRARYALVDLEDSKRIERVVVKAFNEHYVRYAYKIL